MARLEAERRGSDVIDAALAWLDQGRAPFFLWVHLYDPHAPYAAPPEFVAKAGGNAYTARSRMRMHKLAGFCNGCATAGLPTAP